MRFTSIARAFLLSLFVSTISMYTNSTAFAASDIYDFCDTQSDYKKLLNYYRSLRDPSDQYIDYLARNIPKGKSYSELTKKELRNLTRGFKPTTPPPPKVACQKIPGNTLIRVKSGAFSGMACVRPPSWDKCKWIDRRALRTYWDWDQTGKKWVRR